MFARRRDVLEREADRLGALAVRGDVAFRRISSGSWRGRWRPSAVSTSSSTTRRPTADDRSRGRGVHRGRRTAAARLRGPPDRPLPPPRRHGTRPDRDGHVEHREGAGRQPRALEPRPPRRRRLVEDVGARAGAEGHHRQLHRAGRIDTERLKEVYPDGPPRPTSPRAAWAPRARSVTSWRSSAPTAARTSPAAIPVDGGLLRSPSRARCESSSAPGGYCWQAPSSPSSRPACSGSRRRTTTSCSRRGASRRAARHRRDAEARRWHRRDLFRRSHPEAGVAVGEHVPEPP